MNPVPAIGNMLKSEPVVIGSQLVAGMELIGFLTDL